MQNKLIQSDSVPGYFLCAFCKSLIIDPVTCSECLTANFCSKCAKTEISKQGKCPSCRSPLKNDNVAPYNFFLKRYNSEEIKCRNLGCGWHGKIVDFVNHQNNCFDNCPLKDFGCKWRGATADLSAKHSKECQFLTKTNEEIFMHTRLISWPCLLIFALCFFISWWQYYLWGGQIPGMDGNTLNSKEIKEMQLLKEEVSSMAALFDDLRLQYLTKSKNAIGAFRNSFYTNFRYSGFKDGVNITMSRAIDSSVLYNYKYMEYVLVGIRKTNSSTLILAGVGKGSIIFAESLYYLNKENNLFWYFDSRKSFGFSYGSNVTLNDIDVGTDKLDYDEYKLSVSLNGKAGGRVGNQYISKSNNNLGDYELVIMYLDNTY